MGSVVRSEVLQALDQAEARGHKKVRVIVGLRAGGNMSAIKEALARSGAKSYRREAESFLAVELSREQVQRLARLTKHVSSIWLDGPISAA